MQGNAWTIRHYIPGGRPVPQEGRGGRKSQRKNGGAAVQVHRTASHERSPASEAAQPNRE